MAVKLLPDAQVLRQLLDYDPLSGILTWKPRPLSEFSDRRRCNVWNARYAGKEAGRVDRYRQVRVLSKRYAAHRLIWKLMTGCDPAGEIDHIDRDKTNNRWHNLRDVDVSTNRMNVPVRAHSASGEKHIHWSETHQCWVVAMVDPTKGRQRQLGLYETKEAAMSARNQFYLKFGYDREVVGQ